MSTPVALTHSVTSLSHIRRHVWLLFFINGALLASWAVRIPAIQARWTLSEGALGAFLFAMVLGNVLALPPTSAALRRFGLRTTAALSLLGMALGLALLPVMPSVYLAALMLGVFGMGFSGLDLSMNTAGAWLEERLARPVMSGLHAAFSVGALVGALLGSALLARHVSLGAHLGGAAVLAILNTGWCVAPLPRFGTGAGEGTRARFRRLPLPLVGLLVLAFCAALCEGAVTDWSAVMLREFSAATAEQAGLGFALFTLLMVVGRAAGDRLTLRLGAAPLAGLGAALMTLGFLVVLLRATPVSGILGFGLTGLGLSVLAPLAFSAAGRSPEPAALATLTAVFYVGYLVGPPAIGLLSHHASLPTAFLLPVALGVVFGGLALGTRLLKAEGHG